MGFPFSCDMHILRPTEEMKRNDVVGMHSVMKWNCLYPLKTSSGFVFKEEINDLSILPSAIYLNSITFLSEIIESKNRN